VSFIIVKLVSYPKTDGAVNFSLVQSSNIVLVYTIDSYRPVGGEVVVSQFAFKCLLTNLS
jgi:hypothetical protein